MGATIIEAITSGLGLTVELGKNFLAAFTALFWTGTELTIFGQFSFIMLGLSIALGVVSLVVHMVNGNTGA